MQRVPRTSANGFLSTITPLFPVPSVPAVLVPAGGCHLQAACLFSPVLEIAVPALRNVWFSVSLMVLSSFSATDLLLFRVFGQGPAVLWRSREASQCKQGVHGALWVCVLGSHPAWCMKCLTQQQQSPAQNVTLGRKLCHKE